MENYLEGLELTDDVKEKIEEHMKKNNLFFTTLENSEIRYNKLKEKCSKQEEQLKDYVLIKENLTQLQASQQEASITEKDLKEQLEQMKNNYENQLLNLKKENHVQSLLASVDEKYSKILKNLISLDDVKADDFSSIDKQVEDLKDKYPEFFNNDFSSKQSFKGSSKNHSITKEDFMKMTYKERLNLYETNRDLYDKLK